MRGHIAALRAAMDLLVGVKMSQVLLKLHRVQCGEGAEIAAQFVISGVAVPLVPKEGRFV